ncbi:MAG: hypothetical protein HQM16_19215 [Deltaproteobacteria bacterium]|nr:hypothetical protein [Deltaproteobacteria bacterium]
MKNIRSCLFVVLAITWFVVLAGCSDNRGSTIANNPSGSTTVTSITMSQLKDGQVRIVIPIEIFGDSMTVMENSSIDIKKNDQQIIYGVMAKNYYVASAHGVVFNMANLKKGDTLEFIIKLSADNVMNFVGAVSETEETYAINVTGTPRLYWVAYDCGKNICVMSEDGEIKQLTNDGLSSSPVWSPDAGSIYFALEAKDEQGIKLPSSQGQDNILQYEEVTLRDSDIYRRSLNETGAEFYYGAPLEDPKELGMRTEAGIEKPYQFSDSGEYLIVETEYYFLTGTSLNQDGVTSWDYSRLKLNKIIDSDLEGKEYIMACDQEYFFEEFPIPYFVFLDDFGLSPDEKTMVGPTEYFKVISEDPVDIERFPAITACSLDGNNAQRLIDGYPEWDPDYEWDDYYMRTYNGGIAIDNEGALYSINEAVKTGVENIFGDAINFAIVVRNKFRLSPDRDRIAFVLDATLYVISADDGKTLSVTDEIATDLEKSDVVWSRDGNRIFVYGSDKYFIIDPKNASNNKIWPFACVNDWGGLCDLKISPKPVYMPVVGVGKSG